MSAAKPETVRDKQVEYLGKQMILFICTGGSAWDKAAEILDELERIKDRGGR